MVTVTDDGAVVFTRRAATTTSLEVFDPVSGASTVLAARFAPRDQVRVAGKVVAFWAAVDASGIGELGVWTRAGGLEQVGAGSLSGVFSASEDGSRIAFSSNAGAGRTSDISVGSSTLSAAPAVVIRSAVAAAPACQISLAFVQSRLFAATCTQGENAPTIRSVSKDNEVLTVLSSAKNAWATDATGTKVLVISSGGVASVHTIPGNQTTVIDQHVASGKLTPDGNSVVYLTEAGDLKKSFSTTVPLGLQTLATGIRGIDVFAPGLSYALVSSTAPDATNRNLVRHDIELHSISPGLSFIPTPTEPEPLVSSPTGLAVGFVSDGGLAVYLSDLPAMGLPLGTLKAHAVAGREDVVLAHEALTPRLLDSRAQSSRIVFADHPKLEGDRLAAVDVEIVDAATGA